MTRRKIAVISIICLSVLLLSGCDELKLTNERQRQKIAELESDVQADSLRKAQLTRTVEELDANCQVKMNGLQKTIAALEEDSDKKAELINTMKESLLYGQSAMPIELSTMLEEFAATSDMVSFDSEKGIIKFKSDLTFQTGSDDVTVAAVNSIKALCEVMNSETGKNFDVIIAGHTDDVPIGKPETRAKHPTNWHLSVHRAISVLNIMTKNGVPPTRASVRGFGEYRPLAANAADNKGNAVNRRVELYIVPKGT